MVGSGTLICRLSRISESPKVPVRSSHSSPVSVSSVVPPLSMTVAEALPDTRSARTHATVVRFIEAKHLNLIESPLTVLCYRRCPFPRTCHRLTVCRLGNVQYAGQDFHFQGIQYLRKFLFFLFYRECKEFRQQAFYPDRDFRHESAKNVRNLSALAGFPVV